MDSQENNTKTEVNQTKKKRKMATYRKGRIFFITASQYYILLYI